MAQCVPLVHAFGLIALCSREGRSPSINIVIHAPVPTCLFAGPYLFMLVYDGAELRLGVHSLPFQHRWLLGDLTVGKMVDMRC